MQPSLTSIEKAESALPLSLSLPSEPSPPRLSKGRGAAPGHVGTDCFLSAIADAAPPPPGAHAGRRLEATLVRFEACDRPSPLAAPNDDSRRARSKDMLSLFPILLAAAGGLALAGSVEAAGVTQQPQQRIFSSTERPHTLASSVVDDVHTTFRHPSVPGYGLRIKETTGWCEPKAKSVPSHPPPPTRGSISRLEGLAGHLAGRADPRTRPLRPALIQILRCTSPPFASLDAS